MTFIDAANLKSKIAELKRMQGQRFEFPMKKFEELYPVWERTERMNFFLIAALENISKRLDQLEHVG